MVNTVVCIKRVPDVSQIRADPETGAPLLDVPYRISDFDKNALEEAARIKEKHGGKFLVITAGTPDAKTIMKEALAFGADEGYVIIEQMNADALVTSKILASALRKVAYDLIICGEGSLDEYNQQVGARIAEELGIALISYVSKLEVNGNRVVAERILEDRIEVCEAEFPVLVTVSPEINQPRYPTMLQILTASRKPITVWNAEVNVSNSIQTLKIYAPVTQRKRIFIRGSLDDICKDLATKLIEEGCLK